MSDAFRLDPAIRLHQRVLERMQSDEVGWLGTTGRDGYPHAMPVWFLWQDDAIVSFSQPRAAKVQNLREDARASFHFETDAEGEDVQLLRGEVEFGTETSGEWFARHGDLYLAKYQVGLDRLGWTVPRLTDDFSLVLRFRPRSLIGW